MNLVFTEDVSEMENITDGLAIASYVFWYGLRLGLLLIWKNHRCIENFFPFYY